MNKTGKRRLTFLNYSAGGIGSQHSKGKIVIAFNHFDITEINFREVAMCVCVG